MFELFKKGLARVSQGVSQLLNKLGDKPDAKSLEELEHALLEADLGPQAAAEIVAELKKTRQEGRTGAEIVKEILRRRLKGIDAPLTLREGLQTMMIVGVNGAGKTTTVAKLAARMKQKGRNPIIGSADTFRAAANDQLAAWAARAGVPLVESRLGADPAAVAWDALHAAQARGHDTLIIDTAGRLHTKDALMAELGKIEKVMKKLDASAPQHCYLVVDGTLGLNTLRQAKVFHEAVKLTGLIVTKLDGSSKAGALVGLYDTLKLPVYWVGLGEKIEELQEFDLEGYLAGLVGE